MPRVSETAYTEQPWRIHELTKDFTVEDVWVFRTPGAGPDDFPAMLAAIRSAARSTPWTVRFLLAVRWKLGELFGWDKPSRGVGARVPSLRDRLPGELAAQPGENNGRMPLKAVYQLDREAAREMANDTVHGVLHFGCAQGENGDYELRMAVLVKPNGLFGRLYMAAIAPFRHLIVYPALLRHWERAWRTR